MMKMETHEDLIVKRRRTKRPRPLSTSSCSMGSQPLGGGEEEEEDMANCLILLAQTCNKKSSTQESIQEPKHHKASSYASASAIATVTTDKDVYECKTCNRRFHSFQALGGHRASHRRPKHPPSSTTPENQESSNIDQLREEQSTMLSLQIPNRVFSCNTTSNTKQRVHECSICGAEFNSGQALGGHMRRHRPIPTVQTNNNNEETENISQVEKKQTTILALDLNLPAPDEDDQIGAKFGFPTKEQVIVFSTSHLINCHY